MCISMLSETQRRSRCLRHRNRSPLSTSASSRRTCIVYEMALDVNVSMKMISLQVYDCANRLMNQLPDSPPRSSSPFHFIHCAPVGISLGKM